MITKSILLFFVFITFSALGQYKNMGIGLNLGTNDFSKDFISSGIMIQYNTKNLVSFRTGVLFEQTSNLASDYYSVFETDHYVSYVQRSSIRKEHFSIPVLAQVGFGKKLFYSFAAGFMYSSLLRNPYIKSEIYTTGYIGENKDFVSSSEGRVHTDYTDEWNANFILGLSYPVHPRLMLALDVNGIYRLDNNNESYAYNVFRGVRFQLGAAYQFNFTKKSTYTFSNYSIKIRKTTAGN